MAEDLKPTNYWTSNKKRIYKYMGSIKRMHGDVSEMGVSVQTGDNQYQNIPTVVKGKAYLNDKKGHKEQIKKGNVKFYPTKYKTEAEATEASKKHSRGLKKYHGNPWENNKT
mgnify:CR=1 FL=1|tara:strand:+ start:56 stop:391 length:336 start_codon:yes stop_codon:yes gene_type:complete